MRPIKSRAMHRAIRTALRHASRPDLVSPVLASLSIQAAGDTPEARLAAASARLTDEAWRMLLHGQGAFRDGDEVARVLAVADEWRV